MIDLGVQCRKSKLSTINVNVILFQLGKLIFTIIGFSQQGSQKLLSVIINRHPISVAVSVISSKRIMRSLSVRLVDTSRLLLLKVSGGIDRDETPAVIIPACEYQRSHTGRKMTHLSYSEIHNHDKVSRGSKEGMASLNISSDMKMGLSNFFVFFFFVGRKPVWVDGQLRVRAHGSYRYCNKVKGDAIFWIINIVR